MSILVLIFITLLISSQVPSLEFPSTKITSMSSVNLGSLFIAEATLPLSFLHGIITLTDFFLLLIAFKDLEIL